MTHTTVSPVSGQGDELDSHASHTSRHTILEDISCSLVGEEEQHSTSELSDFMKLANFIYD